MSYGSKKQKGLKISKVCQRSHSGYSFKVFLNRVSEESQSHSGPLGTTEKHLTADMNQQLSTHSCASNDVQPEAKDPGLCKILNITPDLQKSNPEKNHG